MNGIILGPPGSGKGTLATWMQRALGLTHISTGDVLRSPEVMATPEGREWRPVIDAGKYVPDEVIISLIAPRLIQAHERPGFILDGCPRTLAQVKLLDERVGVPIGIVIVLRLSDEIIFRRLTGRRYHEASGRVYNIHERSCRPRVEGLDDITGEPLQTRVDDTLAVVNRRLKLFRETVVPVIEYYRQLDFPRNPTAPIFIEIDTAKASSDAQRDLTHALSGTLRPPRS